MENNQEQPSQEVLDRLFEHRNDPNVLKAFNHHFGERAAENYLDNNASATLENEALVIPEADIEYLRENADNPASVRVFNQMHGAGQAESILRPTPIPEEPDDKNGVLYDTLIQAPLAGAEDVLTGVAKFGDWVGDSLFGTMPRVVWGDGNGLRIISGEEFTTAKEQGLVNPEGFNYIDDADTALGGFVQGVTTFAVPYFGAFGKVAKSGKVFQGLMAGAAIDGTIINPDDANLTASLEAMGADMGIVTDLLATDPDDPEWMNRARNMAEGGVLGVAIESVFYGLKAAKAMREGDPEAAQEFLDQSKELSRSIDGEIAKVGQEAADDAQVTIDLADRVFPKEDADGQLSLDLEAPRGQTPEEIGTAVKVPYRLTTDQIENIRLSTQLAESDPQAAAQAVKMSFRSVDTMNDYDDVLAQMSAVKNVLERDFMEMRGGDVQRWSTVKADSTRRLRNMADMLGRDPEEFLAEMTGNINVPPHKLAAEIVAKDRMLLAMELEIKELAEMIDSGKVTGAYQSVDEAMMAFNSRREVAANILMSVDAARANVARALNAMKISRTADPKLRQMIRNNLENSDARAMARAVVSSDQPLKTSLRLGKSLQKAMDNINHFRINALLSGVGTQEVNFVGTAMNSIMIPLQQIAGGQVKHGARTLGYQFSSSLESMRMAAKTFYEDQPILDYKQSKFDMQDDIGKGAKGPAMKVISMPSRLLLTMDEFFKQATYRGRVMADAAMEADAAGLKGQERDAFIQKYLRESFGKTGDAIRPDALLQAQRSTFTEELEAGSFGQKIQALGRGEGAGAALWRFVMPFVRTPMNILSQSFQNMPVLQFTSKRFRDDLYSGDPIRAAQARGKMATAAALSYVGYSLAGREDFTGSGPTDPRIRAEWLKNNQPYSFKVEREDGSFYWVSYQRYEPIANAVSVLADLNEIMRDPYNEKNNSKTNAAAAVMLAIAENTVNKTFTQGLAGFFELFVGDPYTRERSFNSMVGSFVPNILNQTNGDDAFREVRDMVDVLQARTGLYNDVDPKRDILGEIITRPTAKYDPLGLSNIGNYRSEDALFSEISRLSMRDESAFGEMAAGITIGTQRQSLQDIPYGDGPQSLYDHLVELSSTTLIDGKNMRDTLTDFMASDTYQNELIDQERGEPSSGTRQNAISTIIRAFRDQAKNLTPQYLELKELADETNQNNRVQRYLLQQDDIAERSMDRFDRFNEAFQE
jgi:hypothetical protein